MAKWTSTPVQLTAGMVTGAAPLLAADAVSQIDKKLIAIQSRSAGSLEFGFGAAPTAGQGIPLAAGARWDVNQAALNCNGAIYALGGTAGEYVVFVLA